MSYTVTYKFTPGDRVVIDDDWVGVVRACATFGDRNEYFIRRGGESVWIEEASLKVASVPYDVPST